MSAVAGAALPVFALILVGWVAGRRGTLGPAATDVLNLFALNLALPALLFQAMARLPAGQPGQLGFALAFGAGMAAAFAAGFALARRRGGRVARAAVEGMDAGYANVGFMGIPLCLLLFGEAALPGAVMAVLFTACLLFLTGLALVEWDLRGGGWRAAARTVPRSLARNPLLLAPLAGLAAGALGWTPPAPVERFLTLLGAAASPCALVCIGLFLAEGRGGRAGAADAARGAAPAGTVAALVGLKLLLQPAVTALVAWPLLGLPHPWGAVAVLLAALPVGTGPFAVARLHRLEEGVTSAAILVSHAASVVTVSLLVAWLAPG